MGGWMAVSVHVFSVVLFPGGAPPASESIERNRARASLGSVAGVSSHRGEEGERVLIEKECACSC